MLEGYSRKITLNYSVFNELIQSHSGRPSHHSVLVDELQYILLGKQIPESRRELINQEQIYDSLQSHQKLMLNGQNETTSPHEKR